MVDPGWGGGGLGRGIGDSRGWMGGSGGIIEIMTCWKRRNN